jgi:hypothetical protein
MDVGDRSAASSQIGPQLVQHGLVAAGAAIVVINIDPDLTRNDANYLRIQRL